MNTFALPSPTAITVEHVNIRDETHGDEPVVAIDVKLSLETGNRVLDKFDPLLLQGHYFKSTRPPASNPPQSSLPLEEPAEFPDLRWPQLAPLKWKEEQEHLTVTLDYRDEKIVIQGAKVKEYALELKPEGIVRVVWTVQRTDPGPELLSGIPPMLKRQVSVTQIGKDQAQGELISSKRDDKLPAAFDPKSREPRRVKAGQTATDVFLSQHGTKQQPGA